MDSEKALQRVMYNARRRTKNNPHWEMKLRGITMKTLKAEGTVNLDEEIQARLSARKRKLETEFTNRQYEIALDALRKENND